MKATELRIGNLVIHEQTTHVIKNVLEDVCVSDWIEAEEVDNYTHNYNEINPIPLIEDWLLKFGFEKYKDTNNFKIKANKYFSLGLQKQGYLKIGLSNNKWNVTNFGNKSIFIKHVHQLQNLYFALTQQELIIK